MRGKERERKHWKDREKTKTKVENLKTWFIKNAHLQGGEDKVFRRRRWRRSRRRKRRRRVEECHKFLSLNSPSHSFLKKYISFKLSHFAFHSFPSSCVHFLFLFLPFWSLSDNFFGKAFNFSFYFLLLIIIQSSEISTTWSWMLDLGYLLLTYLLFLLLPSTTVITLSPTWL